MAITEIKDLLGTANGYPSVQDTDPVNPLLNWDLTMTPQASSGLPTEPVSINTGLVASLVEAQPFVRENFSYIFGMWATFVPMPRIGRNFYNLVGRLMNGIESNAGLYAFVNLLSNANNLILCKTEFSGQTGKKLVLRNSCVYERPPILGIVAGATEASQIESPFSIAGSVDFQNLNIGGGFTNIVNVMGNVFGLADAV